MYEFLLLLCDKKVVMSLSLYVIKLWNYVLSQCLINFGPTA